MFQLWPNFIFIAALLGLIILVLRRLPQAARLQARSEQAGHSQERQGLRIAVSKGMRKLGRFFLEAKDIRNVPHRMFTRRQAAAPANLSEAAAMPVVNPILPQLTVKPAAPVLDEQYYLLRVQRNPESLSDYASLGQLYSSKKQFVEAERVYRHLVAQDPTNSNYLAKLAYCQLFLKRYPEAVLNYQRSLQLDPGHASRLYNLSIALRALGNFRAAAEALQKASELDPGNQKYKQALAEVVS